MVEGMSVVVNVMLSLMSVMRPPPALCNLSAHTVVKLCILGVFAVGVTGMIFFWHIDPAQDHFRVNHRSGLKC